MTDTIIAPLIIPLDGTGCDTTEVGGKAAGLDRLAAHGLPIPTSFAVTASAYRHFVASAGLAPLLEQLAKAPIPEPHRLEEATVQVEQAFLNGTMPALLQSCIEESAGLLLKEGAVAVRSSATAEDLGEASFAGQYRTFLQLEDLDSASRAIRRCWASLWLPAARAYRQRHGISPDLLAMGVVVQSMIQPDWSGVGFTKDPGGIPDAMRVEMVPGLGEALVSGRVTPEDLVIRRHDLEIRGRPGQDAPLFLEDLARLLLQVEDRLDQPQDVEWAYVDGRLLLLQSRPLTVSGPTAALDDGFDQPVGTSDTFTPRGVAEMLPGVIPPLIWTINRPMLENAFRQVVTSLAGIRPDHRRSFVGRFQGRAALNLSALRDVASHLPGGSAGEVERQFLGRPIGELEAGGEVAARPGLRAVLRARRAQAHLADEIELVSGAVEGLLRLEVQIGELPVRRLLAYERSIRDLAWRITAAEVAASSAAAAAYRSLEMLLSRWLGDAAAAEWAQRLTAGSLSEDAVGVARTRMLRDLCRRAEATIPQLRTALAGRPGSRSRDRVLQLGPAGHRFVAAVDRIVRSQGSLVMFGGPTSEEDEARVWEQLAILAGLDEQASQRADPAGALSLLMNELRSSRHWSMLRVVTGQVVDLRGRWLRRQTSEATRFLRLRERAKAALLALGGEERRVLLEGARRLLASHQISHPHDAELFSIVEFENALLGAPPPPDPDMQRRRRVIRRCRALDPLPELFTGTPRNTDPAGRAVNTATLRGWAASPGVVEGPVRVVRSLEEGTELQRGEILVAPSSDPSWTPLMLVAGGLVLEEGGPLSHGAIVAREFGLPAVLNVGGATAALRDGEEVRVDGYAGVVGRLAGSKGVNPN